MSMKKNNKTWKWTEPGQSLRNFSCLYRVHILNPRNPSSWLSIPRFIAPDPEGIIEIGRTSNFAERKRCFIQAVEGTRRRDEGQMLNYILKKCRPLRGKLGSVRNVVGLLRWSYIPMDRIRLLSEECQTIDGYCASFGEPPLLNTQVPGRCWQFKTDTRKDRIQPDMKWVFTTPRSPLTHMSGVYRIHLLDPLDPSRYYHIPRLVGIDNEGILEIGQTGNLGLRRSMFRQAVRGKSRHTEGQLLHHLIDLCKPLKEIYGSKESILDRLLFSYKEMKTDLRERRECYEIDEYIRRFGEPPVLNSKIPGRSFKKMRKHKTIK
jgi:hypothetical protein